MRPFDLMLVRLKEQLGVREDQEVAEALGISKGALSIRKGRGSFPVDLLRELSDRRGGIDVDYVLTGQHSDRGDLSGSARNELIEEITDTLAHLPEDRLDQVSNIVRALHLAAVLDGTSGVTKRRIDVDPAQLPRLHEPQSNYRKQET